nr:MAG TPA: hypothetical protein [Caudoviricetes sp.]
MSIFKTIFNSIVGLVFGVASMFALAPAYAAYLGTNPGEKSTAIIWIVALVGSALGFFAPTIRRAFGRGFLLLGASLFLLPISTMLLSGRVASEMMAGSGNQAATAVGAGLAGAAITGLSLIVGLVLGGICLIVGLVLALGGRRTVVIAK